MLSLGVGELGHAHAGRGNDPDAQLILAVHLGLHELGDLVIGEHEPGLGFRPLADDCLQADAHSGIDQSDALASDIPVAIPEAGVAQRRAEATGTSGESDASDSNWIGIIGMCRPI